MNKVDQRKIYLTLNLVAEGYTFWANVNIYKNGPFSEPQSKSPQISKEWIYPDYVVWPEHNYNINNQKKNLKNPST